MLRHPWKYSKTPFRKSHGNSSTKGGPIPWGDSAVGADERSAEVARSLVKHLQRWRRHSLWLLPKDITDVILQFGMSGLLG